MHQAGDVECGAIASMEKYRHGRRMSVSNQADHVVVPFRIGDAETGHSHGRYFSGGKYNQKTAVAKPADALAEALPVKSICMGSAKWIDRDHVVSQLGNFHEQGIRQKSDIRSNALKERAHDDSVRKPHRVVRYNDQWPRGGYSLDVFPRAVIAN